MSDFREMLFSKNIEPKNWQELQAKDEAMQKEIDDQLKEVGMSRSDFFSGSTY